MTISPLRDAAGRIFGASTIARDITDRKRSETALRDSEARHRAILETTVDGIITIDDRGIIESVNPATVRLFGYAAAEMIGSNVKMLMPSPDHERHDSYLANYLRTGERKIIGIGREVVGRRKDGTTFPMDLSISEVTVGGRRMFTGLVHDVTQRKQAEEMLRASQEELEIRVRAAHGRVGAGQRAIVAGQGSRRGGQPGQERLPGQHEPRDPHAHERHHRHDGTGAGDPALAPRSATSSRSSPSRARPCCG